jgi:peptidoglycan/LPS O-acetylase OafA/YrhL
MGMQKIKTTNHITGFDGLRAISIMMVLLSHLGFYDNFFQQRPEYDRFLYLFSGTAGVNIFFCLSGFLITWLLINEKRTQGSISFKRFYIKRFFRLSPPLVLFFLTLLVLGFFHIIHISKWGILLSAVYLYNYAPNDMYDTVLGSTWSLALEEQYYLFWPFLLSFFTRNIKLIRMCLVVILVCVIAKLFLDNLSFMVGNEQFVLGDNFKVNRFFIPAVGPVIIGSAFAIFSFHQPLVAIFKKLGNWNLLISVVLYFSPIYLPASLLNFVDFTQAAGVSILLLYLFVYNNKNSIGKLLDIAPLSYIGKISYGIYVYQSFFITTAGKGELVSIQSFPQNIILTLVVSILSYHFWEKWAMKYRDRLLQKLNLRK